MYYHPDMFEWAKRDRVFAAYRAFAVLWLDGVSRQQLAQAEAVSEGCARRIGKLRIVTESNDTAQAAAGLLSCATIDPVEIFELGARLGTIAMDTHRKLSELVASHGHEATRSVVESGVIVDTGRKKARDGGRTVRRRQGGT